MKKILALVLPAALLLIGVVTVFGQEKAVAPEGTRVVTPEGAVVFTRAAAPRREQTIKSIGGMTAGGEAPQSILISDPVAGVSYTLDPANKTARKNYSPFQRTPMAAGAGSGNMVYFGQGTGAGAGQGTPPAGS